MINAIRNIFCALVALSLCWITVFIALYDALFVSGNFGLRMRDYWSMWWRAYIELRDSSDAFDWQIYD